MVRTQQPTPAGGPRGPGAVDVLADRYRLVDRIGRGGMAAVWRAFDEVLDRQVAVKVLTARYAGGAEARVRVLAEARAAARLTHPHVGAVYDYGESVTGTGARVPFVVMELLPGRSLEEQLGRGPVTIARALRICAQVASALAAAHARGLVHRDVKPANVMLTPAGAKVVDFGLAAIAGEPSGQDAAGVVMGTPAYLAPERLSGDRVVAATDVYALGLLLYRLLAGELPWRADTTTQMLMAHSYLAPAPLPALPGLPASVTGLVERCLAKVPADRPSSAEAAAILADAAGIRVPLDDAPGDDALDDEAVAPEAAEPVEPPVPAAPRAAGHATPPGVARPAFVPSGEPFAARLSRELTPRADHVQLRCEASLLLRTEVGFDLALWAVLDPVTQMWASCVVDGDLPDGRFERELFANEYGQQDVLKLVELAAGPRVGTLSASTRGDPRMSARFRNVLAPRGFTDELRLVCHDGGAAWGAVCLLRAGGQFADPDVAALAPASGPLAGLLRATLRRAEAAGMVARPARVPDPQPPPAAPSGRIARLGRGRRRERPVPPAGPARAVPQPPGPLAGRVTLTPDGRLVGMDDDARALFQPGELGALTAALAGPRRTGPVDPAVHRDGRWLAFHADPGTAETTVAVQRISPHQVSELVVHGLRLGPDQRRLLGAVARGRDARQIGYELGITPYAAQDGMLALFEAFAVDGRLGLVQSLFFDHYLPWHAVDARVDEVRPA